MIPVLSCACPSRVGLYFPVAVLQAFGFCTPCRKKQKPLTEHRRSPLLRVDASSDLKRCKVDELQETEIQQEVQMQSERVNQWFNDRCTSVGVDASKLSKLREQFVESYAAALGRAAWLQGRWALAPLIDSIQVPGTSADPDRAALKANCRLELEDMGGGRQLLMLVSSRTLEEGVPLVREVAATAKQMLLEYGTVIEADASTEMIVKAYLAESGPQAAAVQRLVKGALPGRLFGDVIVKGLVKPFARFEGEGGTRMDDLAAAIGESFLKSSLILSAKSLDEIEALEDDEICDFFVSLTGEEKRCCLQELLKLMGSCLGEFTTTLADDERLLRAPSSRGCRRLAVAFRQQRKQALRLGSCSFLGRWLGETFA